MELLIVAAIILIIAVAIPNLRNGRSCRQ